jgi:hypothetical protein
LAGFANKFERTNLSMPSVMVGIIWNPAARSAASGVAIGTLGFAGAYKSDTNADLFLPSYFKVYQNGITSLIKSALLSAAGKEVFIE